MGKSQKFEELAEQVMPLLGGRDNITWFSHCVTRLRFTVKDHGLVDKDGIDALKGAIGSQWAGDQYQIIVGPDVEEAYSAILARGEISGDMAPAAGDAAKPRKRTVGSVASAIIDAISGCITPILPMLVGTGMLRVVLVLLVQLGLITSDNPTYVTLAFAADAGLYFLPIAIGVTGSRKFGVKLGIGIMLGGILLDPTFVQLVKDGTPGSVFGIPITSFSYGSTVFPMVMTMFVAGYVERFFAKISPKPVKSILEPTLTLLVMIPLELCLIGPLRALLGTYLMAGIMWVYDTIGFVGVAIVCCLYPILVMTGMHTTLLPFLTQSFATLGYDPFVGAAQLVSNMTQGVAALAVAIKTKGDEDLQGRSVDLCLRGTGGRRHRAGPLRHQPQVQDAACGGDDRKPGRRPLGRHRPGLPLFARRNQSLGHRGLCRQGRKRREHADRGRNRCGSCLRCCHGSLPSGKGEAWRGLGKGSCLSRAVHLSGSPAACCGQQDCRAVLASSRKCSMQAETDASRMVSCRHGPRCPGTARPGCRQAVRPRHLRREFREDGCRSVKGLTDNRA